MILMYDNINITHTHTFSISPINNEVHKYSVVLGCSNFICGIMKTLYFSNFEGYFSRNTLSILDLIII